MKSLFGLRGGMPPIQPILEMSILLILGSFLLFHGTAFEVPYPPMSVQLYDFPWWRLLIVWLVILGTSCSPVIGMATAAAAFFYLQDMHLFTNPFSKNSQ